MGYTTEFRGDFQITPALSGDVIKELISFAATRHGGNIEPFEGMPGLYCDWVPSEDGTKLCWNGSEKFYHYVEWLEWLIGNKFAPKSYKLNGSVKWRGEDFDDVGIITIKDNIVLSKVMEVNFN